MLDIRFVINNEFDMVEQSTIAEVEEGLRAVQRQCLELGKEGTVRVGRDGKVSLRLFLVVVPVGTRVGDSLQKGGNATLAEVEVAAA